MLGSEGFVKNKTIMATLNENLDTGRNNISLLQFTDAKLPRILNTGSHPHFYLGEVNGHELYFDAIDNYSSVKKIPNYKLLRNNHGV